SSFRLLLTSLFLASALGSYAQVTISETDSQQLKSNLLEVRTILTNWGESLNERESELSARELSLKKKESDLQTREADLLTKENLISELSISLTIACESLSEADQAAIKLEAENKLLKIGGMAGWVAALIAAGFIIFN
ncbi:MAG: hypothetical protein WCQ59_09480, partial [Candidatus Cloacimonadaceae bacterium]